MKKIICVLYTLSAFHLYGENHERNAFIEIGMVSGMYTMQIEYNGHNYITPFPYHCVDCPCLTSD